MILLGLGVALVSLLAADELASRRGQVGRAAAEVARTTAGMVVVGALGYGLAAEGRRLAGALRSVASEHLPGA